MKILALLCMLLTPAVVDDTAVQPLEQEADTSSVTLTLEDALKIALSENIAVQVADKEIKRTTYAKRGTYAALFPTVDASGAFQHAVKKQVVYFDGMDKFPGVGGSDQTGGDQNQTPSEQTQAASSSGDNKNNGMEMGRTYTWNAGFSASMPIINAQLWQSIRISADEVELAVEKARGSRLETVTSVKESYYAVLLAKAANKVFEQVYENACENLKVTESKYASQKASEMELLRAKTTVANAIPDVYNSRNNIDLALWRLKAVMGVDLDMKIDVEGSLEDYAQTMFYDLHEHDQFDLAKNSSLRQMDMQIMEMKKSVQLNRLAYVPSVAASFNYSWISMANDFKFSEYKWNPYSTFGLSIQIPILSGGKRYNAVKQSKMQMEQLQLQKVNAERNMQIAVKSNLATMETNMNSYYAAESALESARKGYDISAESYKVGRSTLVELNDAMLALSQTELLKYQSIHSFLVAKASLEQQLGQDFIVE